ncbi:MAG TPA: SpoIIE family protein phosphatase [Candidatus Binatia bacterium]|jgi:serine phosphatase RsbU (regulator of sigma subunit)|nr:SpoIIE family protein phosphatase [Candidatus Binatia bacterium]
MIFEPVLEEAFKGLEKETLTILGNVAHGKAYPAGTILCRQGRIEDTFYIVAEGSVAVVQDLDDGQQRLLAMRGPGEYFGELSLLDDTPRVATCVTTTETRVLEVTRPSFDTIVRESPTVAYGIVRHVVRMLRENDRLALEDLAQKNRELRAAYDELRQAQQRLVESERLEHELQIAANVQRSLLPARLPQFDDYSFASYLRPARHVGGDFFDVIELDDMHVAVLLADVVDKSVHAALMMAVTRTLFRTECRRSLSPAEVATAVHRGMLDISEQAKMFLTAFYGVLHRPSGFLRYVLAGHERPLAWRPGRGVEPLSGKGRFLGMIDPLHLDEYVTHLRQGDRLLAFSDGVTDAMNRLDQPFGHEQLARSLDKNADKAGGALLEQIASDVAVWTQNAPPFDDLTMLLVETRSSSESASN